jgi:hypothetical protein
MTTGREPWAGRLGATCGLSLCGTPFKGVGSNDRTPPAPACAYQTASTEPLAGSARSPRPVVIIVVRQWMQKGPSHRGARFTDTWPAARHFLIVAAPDLRGAGRRILNCVRNRSPDVRGENRSGLRLVSPGDDDADGLRRCDFLTILLHCALTLIMIAACCSGL